MVVLSPSGAQPHGTESAAVFELTDLGNLAQILCSVLAASNLLQKECFNPFIFAVFKNVAYLECEPGLLAVAQLHAVLFALFCHHCRGWIPKAW